MTFNIKLGELVCRCGCKNHVFYETELRTLAFMLQRIRDHFGKPIIISSGLRCTRHNTSVKGADNSYHMSGMAADVRVPDVSIADLYKEIDRLMADGVILSGGLSAYDTFVHYDFRGHNVRF